MAGSTLGWGLVGLGGIADKEIAPAITSTESATLVGVVSRDQGRAEAFAQRHGALHALHDYDQLLAEPSVGAVYIATPNALHVDQTIAAARAGKHVLCDKPLAMSAADAERVISECDKAGVSLGVTFQTRNHEGMADAKAAIAEGRIGSVVLAEIEMSPGRTMIKGWRTDKSLAGIGAMNNIGVHAYDLLRYLLGSEVSEVTAMLASEPGFDLDLTSLALMRFENGALAYVNANQTVPNFRPDVVVYGSKGRIIFDNLSRPNREGTIEVLTEEGRTERPADSKTAYRKTVGDFTQAVLEGREPSPSGLDGLRSVELTDAMSTSAREGRLVRLSR
ncbi:MAG: Gfo/Idh/MocA family protein [Acidimicrobiales bacterium]